MAPWGAGGGARKQLLDRKDSVWQTKLVEVVTEPPVQEGGGGVCVKVAPLPQTQLQTPPTPVHHHTFTCELWALPGHRRSQKMMLKCFFFQWAVLLVRRAPITLWMFSSGTRAWSNLKVLM